MPIGSGARLDAYELVRHLGSGGMGEVWLATDLTLGRSVALKLLPADVTRDPSRVARFEREARAASALSHPNVCTILGLGHTPDGQHYIAMEHVDGSTLRQRLVEGHLAVDEALDIAIQIAAALDAAHAAGIVHRDIKPENVMIRRDGLVKVLDFGLAKLDSSIDVAGTIQTVTRATELGAVVGTVGYMSPEQAEGKPVDHRSDVFAFGLLLYEMTAGVPAFRGASSVATLGAILYEEPAALPASVPADLKKLVLRCLHKRPDERYQDMRDVRLALEEIRDAVSDRRSRYVTAKPRIARVPALALWAVAGISVIVMAAAAWVYRAGRETPHAMLEPVPLTSDPGIEEAPSFSPDGSQVAYSWNGPGQDNYDIYVKLIGAPKPLRLTTDPADDRFPAFSPDGRSIGFVRLSDERATYVVMPAVGGSERSVATIPASSADAISPIGESWTSAWLPDGESIVLDGLRVLSLRSGELSPLLSGSGRRVEGWYPSVAPDGHALAFCRPSSLARYSVYVVDLTGGSVVRGEPRRVLDVDGEMFGLTWTADSRQLVFASGPLSGTSGISKTLRRVDAREGASPEQLPLGSDLTLPAISRNGARLAFVKTSFQADIFRVTLAPPGALAPAPERFVSSTRSDWNPQYSPDGLRLAFESTRTGESAVWMSDADGSNLLEIFSKAGKHSGTPRWSPDSQRLAFDSSAEGNFDVYVIRPGSRQPQRLTADPADDAIPSWSPDGRWIYFASNRTGRYELWKVPSGGGPAVQVTRDGGLCAHASADGTKIFYTKHDGDSPLWVMPVAGGPEQQVLPSVTERTFDVVADGVYFVPRANHDGQYAVYYLDFATSAVVPVFQMAGAPAIGLSVSPDRRRAVYAQRDAADRDLMLVEGFR